MFKCPNCSKAYKNNGKWLLKHMIEVCHVKSLKAIELIPKETYTDILNRINHLESIVRNIAHNPKDISIERIKREEDAKRTNPELSHYREAFRDCISELKEILTERKEKLDKLELAEVKP